MTGDMRSRDIIIFFSAVFIIYSGANIFLYFRGLEAISGLMDRGLYTILFILISLSFIAGRILERSYSSVTADILSITGGFWLSFMFYSIMIIIVSDLSTFILRLSGIISADTAVKIREASFLSASWLSLLIIIAGFINTLFPLIKKYEINISGKAGAGGLKIAAVSDIHLGSVIGKRSMRVLSRRLKKISPDMLLLLGDIVDGEINPVLRNDLLGSLKVPAGVKYVFAITGNHEYIGDRSQTIPYIESKGIKVLIDETIILDEGIVLAGRKDRDVMRYTGEARKSLDELLKGVDHDMPVIVMDHQPPMKKENNLSGFDLMLSGHTHRGQMWPLNH
ncbi:MAG: metallophosphoesterase, partial [Bacteroidales bacterium]|nr:metallophosphoesterase [Bacteroidales bacterium]